MNEAMEKEPKGFKKWWYARHPDGMYLRGTKGSARDAWRDSRSAVLEEVEHLCDEKAQYYTGIGKGRIAAEIAEAIRSLANEK